MIETTGLGLVACLVIIAAIIPVAFVLSRRAPEIASAPILVIVAALHITFGWIRFDLLGTWAPDAGTYHTMGKAAAYAIATGTDFEYTTGKEGWPKLIGYVYYAVGPDPRPMILLASASVVAAAWLAGRTAMIVHSGRAGRYTFCFVSLWPTFFLWGDSLLRESACWILLGLTMLGWTRAILLKSLGGWFLVGVGLLGLVAVRGTLAVLLAASIIVAWVLFHALQSTGRRGLAVIIAGGAVIVGPALLTSVAANYGYSLDYLNRSRAQLSNSAETSFGVVTSYSSTSDVVVGSASLLPRALAGPFPWEWAPTGGGVLTAFDAMTWWLVLALIFRVRREVSMASIGLFVIPALGVLLPLAATSGNYGTLVRLRTLPLYLVAPLIGAAIAGITAQIRNKRAVRADVQRPNHALIAQRSKNGR